MIIIKSGTVKARALKLFIFFSFPALLFFPSASVSGARSGIELCLNSIIPSLFPFFIVTSLMIRMGADSIFSAALSPLMRLFSVDKNCACAFASGLVGGYPSGARTVHDLYTSGKIDAQNADKCMLFSNNSGPAFIVSYVGASLMSSMAAGWLLYVSHVISSITIGVLVSLFYRARLFNSGKQIPPDIPKPQKRRPSSIQVHSSAADEPFSSVLISCVLSSMQSILKVCAFVIFAKVIISVLEAAYILDLASWLLSMAFPFLSRSELSGLLTGMLEMTSGCQAIGGIADIRSRLCLMSFIISFGGLSIFLQSTPFFTKGFKKYRYIFFKLIQAALSAASTYLLLEFFPLGTVSAYAPYTTSTNSKYASLLFPSVVVIGLFLLWLIFRKAVEKRNMRDYNKNKTAGFKGANMNKALFNDEIEPMCEYCVFSRGDVGDGNVLCPKKGVVSFDYMCSRYMYDPLKRKPKRPPHLR